MRIKSRRSIPKHSVAWKSTQYKVLFTINYIDCIFRKLKRLNLGGNDLTQVPQKSLSILDTLKKLEIQENKIRTISEGDFEGNIKVILIIFIVPLNSEISSLVFFGIYYEVNNFKCRKYK